jgi:hypothetical protein
MIIIVFIEISRQLVNVGKKRIAELAEHQKKIFEMRAGYNQNNLFFFKLISLYFFVYFRLRTLSP